MARVSRAFDLRSSTVPFQARPPRQLGDEVLERHHELIRPSQVGVDELIAEHLAADAQPSVEIVAGGHTGDDTGNTWLTHGSQVEDEPAEAACTRLSTPAFTLDTADTTAESVLGEAARHPQRVRPLSPRRGVVVGGRFSRGPQGGLQVRRSYPWRPPRR